MHYKSLKPSSHSESHTSTKNSAQDIDVLCRANYPNAIKYGKTMWSQNLSLQDRLDLGDAESAAGVGLYRAATTWNATAGDFISWMRRHVRYEVLEASRQATPIPRTAMAKLKELRAVEIALEESCKCSPSASSISKELGITEFELAKLYELRNSAREASELPSADLLGSTIDTIKETNEGNLVDEAMAAFGPLSGDERVVMALYYMEGISFKEVANIFDKRPDAISRVHGRAKDRLVEFLQDEGNTATAV